MGCSKTFHTSVNQPNPLASPLETLRQSEELVIVTGDMELNKPRRSGPSGGSVMVSDRVPLNNKASFTVVSRDRLRFHVQIEHKWEEWAKVTGWSAELVDDKGRHYRPEDIDLVSAKHVVQMWDYERRSVVRNKFGDIVHVNNDGYKQRQFLGSLSLFRGRGDYVFYSRDIFTPDVRSLTLILKRRSMTFKYTWNFSEDATGTGTTAKEGESGGSAEVAYH
jgi:hypothetical protein